MNILIPHSWLLEHLATLASPEEIQKLVSLSGPSIERIYDKEGEPVFDIEVTTNRVDSMSVRGIAREAAVILEQAGIPAQLKEATIPAVPQPSTNLPLPTIINDPALCKRIMTVVLSNVQHSATPEWMGKRLTHIDQNIHDAVIDITNYITHELGHPCHAFDYDKIMALGSVIKVVAAQPGKKFVTLDAVEYTTVGGEVVFENDKGEIIDLPAIKGTLNSSIDDTTTNVLFWIESIPAKKVRFGSMSHAIRTVAAQLNEKNVDPYLAEAVLQRGVQLYQELCGASVASTVYDDFPQPPVMQPVTLQKQVITNYLGITLENDVITRILESLECQVSWQGDATLVVTPPTFRPDVTIPADVVEELARIYGYHTLPSTLMATTIPLHRPAGAHFEKEQRIKEFLADLGWQEVYTYSMVSEAVAQYSGFPVAEHLKLQNPLTDDRVYLRRSLIPSLLEVLEFNSEVPNLCVFEIAKVYHPVTSSLPNDELHLTLVSQQSYRETRGVLEALLRAFYVTELTIEPTGTTTASIVLIGASVGEIISLPKARTAVDIRLAALMPLLKSHPTYQPIAKTAPMYEDLTFMVPTDVAIGELIDLIKQQNAIINSVELTDIYERNHTFRVTYHDSEKNLSSTDIEPTRKKIVATVAEKFSSQLVGAL